MLKLVDILVCKCEIVGAGSVVFTS